MDSGTKKAKIHVRLLGEGTEVSRSTEAMDFGGGLFQLLSTAGYDPQDEVWEFPPGSVVRAEEHSDKFRQILNRGQGIKHSPSEGGGGNRAG